MESVLREIRGRRVILDADIAALYDVPTKALVQAVKRNLERFPEDFMFQLAWEEVRSLRSQSVTLDTETGSQRGKHMKYQPFAFTEQGVAMLSSVLRSDRAVQVNIEIMRTFVRLRQTFSADTNLTRRLDALEAKYDRRFKMVFDAIRMLITGQAKLKARVGRLEEPPEPPTPPNLRRIR